MFELGINLTSSVDCQWQIWAYRWRFALWQQRNLRWIPSKAEECKSAKLILPNLMMAPSFGPRKGTSRKKKRWHDEGDESDWVWPRFWDEIFISLFILFCLIPQLQLLGADFLLFWFWLLFLGLIFFWLPSGNGRNMSMWPHSWEVIFLNFFSYMFNASTFLSNWNLVQINSGIWKRRTREIGTMNFANLMRSFVIGNKYI